MTPDKSKVKEDDMKKHTVGPWIQQMMTTLEEGVECRQPSYREIVAGKGFYPEGFGLTGFMSKEDAQLIASAPELLEACKLALVAAIDGGSLDGQDLIQIEKAIAKAEGRT